MPRTCMLVNKAIVSTPAYELTTINDVSDWTKNFRFRQNSFTSFFQEYRERIVDHNICDVQLANMHHHVKHDAYQSKEFIVT